MMAALALMLLLGTAPAVGPTPVMRSAQIAPPATADLPRLADVPNVEITYYDVTGNDIAEIHRAVAKHAPRDPTTQAPLPATSSWSVGVAVKSLTTGKRCKITGVTLDFRGQATMPRLVQGKELSADAIATWNAYVARIEARQAAQLRFAYDRLGEVEKAVIGSRCGQSETAADSALQRLKDAQLLAFKPDKSTNPRLEEPSKD